ncbi:hypothetical protein PI126_g22014 [Phytophthora idaei]|nr:hypothetical protein PI126_g22014 [Phytophthora idaei]
MTDGATEKQRSRKEEVARTTAITREEEQRTGEKWTSVSKTNKKNARQDMTQRGQATVGAEQKTYRMVPVAKTSQGQGNMETTTKLNQTTGPGSRATYLEAL